MEGELQAFCRDRQLYNLIKFFFLQLWTPETHMHPGDGSGRRLKLDSCFSLFPSYDQSKIPASVASVELEARRIWYI